MNGQVPSRELRNNTAGLLRRAESGEQLTITVAGRPTAILGPIASPRRWVSREAFVRLLSHQADPALREDLDLLAPDTTEDLPL